MCCAALCPRSPDEIAVCNLASIALPRFVREQGGQSGWEKKLVGSLDAGSRYFDFEKLAETTKVRATHAGGTASPRTEPAGSPVALCCF